MTSDYDMCENNAKNEIFLNKYCQYFASLFLMERLLMINILDKIVNNSNKE